jgi:hypothetical protein
MERSAIHQADDRRRWIALRSIHPTYYLLHTRLLLVGDGYFSAMNEFVVQTDEVDRATSLEELDEILDRAHQACDPERPLIATIEKLHDCRVDVGLGAADSFVIIWPRWPSPEADTDYMTVSPECEAGTKWFWLHGVGDTEFDRRNLVPYEVARRIVREFFRTGVRSPDVVWEEEHF